MPTKEELNTALGQLNSKLDDVLNLVQRLGATVADETSQVSAMISILKAKSDAQMDVTTEVEAVGASLDKLSQIAGQLIAVTQSVEDISVDEPAEEPVADAEMDTVEVPAEVEQAWEFPDESEITVEENFNQD